MNANNITKGGGTDNKQELQNCMTKRECLEILINTFISSDKSKAKITQLLNIINSDIQATDVEKDNWNKLYDDLNNQRDIIDKIPNNNDKKILITTYFNNLIVIILKNIIDTIILEYLNDKQKYLEQKQNDLEQKQEHYAKIMHIQRITETINMINKFIIKIRSFYDLLDNIKTNYSLFTLYKNQLLPFIKFLLEDINFLNTQITEDKNVTELKETITLINKILDQTNINEDQIPILLDLLNNIKELPNKSDITYNSPPDDTSQITAKILNPAPKQTSEQLGLLAKLKKGITAYTNPFKTQAHPIITPSQCSELVEQINKTTTGGGEILSGGKNINKHFIKYINEMRILFKYYNTKHKYYKYKIKYLNLIKSNTI